MTKTPFKWPTTTEDLMNRIEANLKSQHTKAYPENEKCGNYVSTPS